MTNNIYGNGLALGGLAHMFNDPKIRGQENKANILMNRETNAMNYLMQQQTNAQNYKIWQEQKEYNLDMWNRENDYNNPANQRKRLEQAGLNPYLMLNGGSAGIAGSVDSANAPNMQSTQFSAPQVDTSYSINKLNSINTAVANISDKLYNFRLQNAQASKLEGENVSQSLSNLYLADFLQSRNRGAKANAVSSEHNVSTAKNNADISKISFDIAKETKQDVIDKAKSEKEAARQQVFLAEQLVLEKELDIGTKTIMNKYLEPQQVLKLLGDLTNIAHTKADIQYKKAATQVAVETAFGHKLDNRLKKKTIEHTIRAMNAISNYNFRLHTNKFKGLSLADITGLNARTGYSLGDKSLKTPVPTSSQFGLGSGQFNFGFNESNLSNYDQNTEEFSEDKPYWEDMFDYILGK